MQGDTEAETTAGLKQLLSLGLVEWMRPKLLTDNRWMARAIPAPVVAAEEPDGA